MTRSTADVLIGVGVDLVKVERVGGCLDAEPFVRSTFTPRERRRAAAAPDPVTAYAAIFAAKEAVFKAMGLAPQEITAWADVEVLDTDPRGLTTTLHGRVVDVEITHLPAPEGHVLCMAQARKEPGP